MISRAYNPHPDPLSIREREIDTDDVNVPIKFRVTTSRSAIPKDEILADIDPPSCDME